jgi:hypothetical protein
MYKEMVDEARTENPLKHAAVAAKQASTAKAAEAAEAEDKATKQDNNNPSGGRRDDSKKTPIPKTDCKSCGFAHQGGEANCWWSKPHLAPESWREHNAEKLKTRASKSDAATVAMAFGSPPSDYLVNFTIILVVTETVSKLAGRSEYHRQD